ncbi:GGDEF domain-containing protein [Aliikangiella sp. IMCC44632]
MSVFFKSVFVVASHKSKTLNSILASRYIVWAKLIAASLVSLNITACKSEFDVFLTPFEQLSLPLISLVVAILLLSSLAFWFRYQHNFVNRIFSTKSSQPVALDNAFLNRKALSESLSQEITKAQKNKTNFSAVQIKLDDFSNWHQTLCVEERRRIEKAFQSCLVKPCNTLDVCFKISPSDYVVLLPETQIQPAVAFASKVLEETRKIKCTANYLVSASIGITTFHCEDNVTDFLQRLNKACLKAMESGGNHFVAKLAS